jgi:hypothetical protein
MAIQPALLPIEQTEEQHDRRPQFIGPELGVVSNQNFVVSVGNLPVTVY